MKKLRLQIVCATLLVATAITVCASTVLAQSPSPAELKQKVDAYLRNLFAFGPEVKLAVGDFKETGIPGLLET